MKRFLLAVGFGILSMGIISCNSSSDGGSSSGSSGSTTAVLSAVRNSVTQANNSAPRVQELFELSENPQTTTPIAATFNCMGGGSSTITGSLTESSSGTNPVVTNLSYEYTIVFNQCVGAGTNGQNYTISGTGVTISGTSVWQTAGTFPNQTFATTDNLTVGGDITVSGAENINCPISLTEQISSMQTSSTINESGSYNGTVCGTPENGTISVKGTVSST